MKKIISIILVLCLALCLVSCDVPRERPEPENGVVDIPGAIQPGASDGDTDTADDSAEERNDADAEKTDDTAPVETVEPFTYEFSTVTDNDANVTGTLTASCGGEKKWEYVTEPVPLTELEVIQDIGETDSGYLLLAGGDIFCLDKTTGEVKWRNSDFGGASASWDFDDEGILYMCGYYGPDLFAVKPDGTTLIEDFYCDDDFYWPADLEYKDGKVEVYFYSNDRRMSIDPADCSCRDLGIALDKCEGAVSVSDVSELINAIDEGATIVLEPGVYNLTEFLDEADVDFFDEDIDTDPGAYLTDEFDGRGMVIRGYDSLTFISADPDEPAEIVIEPRYADVLSFLDCGTVQLTDLILGHTPEQGSCAGDVVSVRNTDFCVIDGCDLYGCGVYGINADTCQYVQVSNTCIHDCSEGCAMLDNVDSAYFDTCTFRDCHYISFDLDDCLTEFFNCTFRRLDGTMLYVEDSSRSGVSFYDCTFDAAALDSIKSDPLFGRLINIY